MSSKLLSKLPKMEYQQKMGEYMCRVSSICSALHWLGLEMFANMLYANILKYSTDSRQPEWISKTVGVNKSVASEMILVNVSSPEIHTLSREI